MTSRTPGHSSERWLLLLVVLFALYQLTTDGGLLWRGEMWAEMGANYFPAAQSPSLLVKLFATDAGYIPLPQRLIALLGQVLGLPAAAIPYYYSLSATLLAPLLAGTFCLPAFRRLVPSDGVRFAACLLALANSDFDTRSFINFTYFALFMIAAVTALAAASGREDLPGWCWIIPPLMMAKPHVMVVLPAMIVVATLVPNRRFRLIAGVSALLCAVQLAVLAINQSQGTMQAAVTNLSLASKLLAAGEYFLGFLSRYLLLPTRWLPASKVAALLAVGTAVLALLLVAIWRQRGHQAALIAVGLSLVFFNALLNCFALGAEWNVDLAQLGARPGHRHLVGTLFGSILIVTGLIAMVQSRLPARLGWPGTAAGLVIFALWAALPGTMASSAWLANRIPAWPVIGNSHWQASAAAIQWGSDRLCVPIDPFGWIYARGCRVLNPQFDQAGQYEFHPVPSQGGRLVVDLAVPAYVRDHTLISVGLPVRPAAMQTQQTTARAIAVGRDGTRHELAGGDVIPATGGLLLLSMPRGRGIADLDRLVLEFGLPVELASVAGTGAADPTILWMGY